MTAAHSATDIRDMLLDAAGLSVDRLPMLHVIFDRMSTSCAEHLRHMAASPMYYSLSGLESGRITEILEMYEANAVAGIFHAPEWDSHILIGFDRDFIYTHGGSPVRLGRIGTARRGSARLLEYRAAGWPRRSSSRWRRRFKPPSR